VEAQAAKRKARTRADSPTEAALPGARSALLDAAQSLLQTEGVASLSTRRVAAAAGQPLSQIHYHFGSKQGLMLALLDYIDEQTLHRQRAMYGTGTSLSVRWYKACDFLDEDLASGYVRLLQECIALGWSDEAIAERVRALFHRWYSLLTEVAREAEARFGPLGPFSPAEVAALAGNAFVGAESELLLRIDETHIPIRSALRKIGLLIEALERARSNREDEP
jgi:AcrR family transcriptional regulator